MDRTGPDPTGTPGQPDAGPRCDVAQWAKQRQAAQEAALDPVQRIALALALGRRVRELQALAKR